MTSSPGGDPDPGAVRQAMYKRRLADNIRRLRLERNWTQEEAARTCGISTRIFQRCEAGTVNATLLTLARLAAGFEVDLCVMFHASEDTQRDA